jgi:hypothetical protein
MKKNCWEFKQCGRETGGVNADTLGVCPASTAEGLEGIHGGKNAGRACWMVAGTYCRGKTSGTFISKYKDCKECDFYKHVREEEDKEGKFMHPIDLLETIFGKG